eukprot:5995484-Amphidinium_carterae.1
MCAHTPGMCSDCSLRRGHWPLCLSPRSCCATDTLARHRASSLLHDLRSLREYSSKHADSRLISVEGRRHEMNRNASKEASCQCKMDTLITALLTEIMRKFPMCDQQEVLPKADLFLACVPQDTAL